MSFYKKRLRPRLLVVYALALLMIWSARPSVTTLMLGLVPIAAGEALRLWATGFLHKTDALTVFGPYAFVRHPLYTGSLLIGAGFALMAGTWVAYALLAVGLCVFFAYYLPYKNRIEGARLEAAFGDAYRRYATAVPMVFPRLHAYTPVDGPTGVTEWNTVRFADNNEVGTAMAVGVGVLAFAVRWALL